MDEGRSLRRPVYCLHKALAVIIMGFCLFALRAEAGEVSASLLVTETQHARPSPNRQATLKVRNGLKKTISAVGLRSGDGGPMLLYPITIAPTRQATLAVMLPGTSPEQTYTVRCFDTYDNGTGESTPVELAEASASVSWPAGLVADEPIICPAVFDVPSGADGCRWPVAFRQQVLLALAGMLMLGAFVLRITCRWFRAAAGVGVVGAGVALLVWMAAQAAPPLASAKTMHLLIQEADGQQNQLTMCLLVGRRTTWQQGDLADAWCVYPDSRAMARDQTVLRPREPAFSGGAAFNTRLAPNDVKVFLACQAGRGPDRPGHVTAALGERGDVCIQSDRPTGEGVLVFNDRIVPVEALTGQDRQQVAAGADRPMADLVAAPGQFGFDADSLRLFAWWWSRTKRQRDQIYLLYPAKDSDALRLYALTVAVK
ncbi:MAG: hypothetical protein HQ546_11800 [Planctomycetes bacterium]|nr:hypothetical protein [Planctomycetota bacterium]